MTTHAMGKKWASLDVMVKKKQPEAQIDNAIEDTAFGRDWIPYGDWVPALIRLGPHAARLPWPRDVVAEARAKFWEALKAGKIVARGVRFATGEVENISCRDWIECQLKRGELREPGRRLPRFINLEISGVDVRREFANEPSTVALTKQSQPFVYSTGAPGRPSPMPFVEREALRRRQEDLTITKVGEEAEALHKWCMENHATIAAPTSKTIANRISEEHRAWKAQREKPQN